MLQCKKMSKKLLNSPSLCVDEALEGLVSLYPCLSLIPEQRVVIRRDYEEVKKRGQVAIVSGGGSGHEPFCGGYVGEGMLTAATAGHVFASPPPQNILTAIREVGEGNDAGTLIIVLNYTGDRLNFGLSQERARSLGIRSDMFISMDDCAQIHSKSRTGRRGLCGTLFLFKIAGAMAECGSSLEDIVETVKSVSQEIGTIGVSLSACSVPGSGPMFSLESDKLELGLGVHGEAGVTKIQLCPAKEVVKIMLTHMRDPKSPHSLQIQQGDEIALLINNLGGTSQLEQLVMAKEIISQLESEGIRVVRAYYGALLTSLEMQGIQFSILRLKNKDKVLEFLDAPTNAPAWPNAFNFDRKTPSGIISTRTDFIKKDESEEEQLQFKKDGMRAMKEVLKGVLKELTQNEQLLNEYDSGSGDGDCGSTLVKGVKEIEDMMTKEEIDFWRPRRLLRCIAHAAETRMGGASGAIYSILFTTFSNQLKGTEPSCWYAALKKATTAVMEYGGAQTGDRTMLDSLVPAVEALNAELQKGVVSIRDLLRTMADEAESGAQSTLKMVPRAGRASTVSVDRMIHPDPGAVSVSLCIRAIQKSL